MSFEPIPHTGDMAVVVKAASRDELFSEAVRAMFAMTQPRQDVAERSVERSFNILSLEENSLLVDLMNQALAEAEINHEAYQKVIFDELKTASARGRFIGLTVAGFETPIKAVTHHNLIIRSDGDQWTARITFDV